MRSFVSAVQPICTPFRTSEMCPPHANPLQAPGRSTRSFTSGIGFSSASAFESHVSVSGFA